VAAFAVLAKRIARHTQLLNCNRDYPDVSLKKRLIQIFAGMFAAAAFYNHWRFQH